MLKILKSKKAQNTAEYAILIALVVGAVIAMQTYVQRGLQARTRGTSLYMRDEITNAMLSTVPDPTLVGNTAQYNPYYSNQVYQTTRNSEDVSIATPDQVGSTALSTKSRAAADNLVNPTTGYEKTDYNALIGATGQD
jgi:uncharacterized protein (UPF0333 family)